MSKLEKLVSLITEKECQTDVTFKAKDLPTTLFRGERIFKESDIFSKIHSEHQFVRYITSLQNKDVSLTDSMIPLGSCTLKLNSAYQLDPLTHPKMNIHPFVPGDQSKGYIHFISLLSQYLLQLTQMDGVSYMSNSGATGEYSGLLTIKQYHESHNQF